MNKIIVIIILLVAANSSFAQTTENKAWFFLSHTQEVSKKWNILADVQVRSANKLKRVETLLLRSALSYNLTKKHAVALGYAYKGDWEEELSKLNYQLEHRLYQQYLYSSSLKRTELTVRFRSEQRFVKEEAAFNFSQRLRGFLSFQIPVAANKDFSKGLYLALQNEVFINVLQKERVNNHFLDQNRAYAALGYRCNKKLDMEIGYYNWQQKDRVGTTVSNVVQLMFTTTL